ncbi:glucose-6-phosphate 1-dehydrogenase-like [Oppia nitens]|uniref:glucose-6-phosphate 1-dehydrogenase-like n=1 Tax=Oppia nitens TaxID=1686743 RepID=UPI0023DCBDD7|nr:glucose-6-phosphate 1-dehydrogenase-like [Oppia nitens]
MFIKHILLTVLFVYYTTTTRIGGVAGKSVSDLDDLKYSGAADEANTFILLGITGDLSRKKLMPTLFTLYKEELLPKGIQIVGFGHSKTTVPDLRKQVDPYVHLKDERERQLYDEFWKIVQYFSGDSTKSADYKQVVDALAKIESGKPVANRLIYFALPPNLFADTARALKETVESKTGWTRMVIEKPFGKDSESSDVLSKVLSSLFREDQIYRIDHYLGKEMVQNLLALRFGNRLLEPQWNNRHVANIEVLFKEPFGTQGRGDYFEQYGIIRDVVQNHLLQVLALVTMERPESSDADKIRNEKLYLLQHMKTLVVDDVVLGQYVRNPNGVGEANTSYTDDPKVPKNSTAATYSLVVLHVDNDRWRGVPMFIRSGKATDESRVEIRVQYKPVDEDLFGGQSRPDQTVIRIQPNEAVYQRLNIKRPGMGNDLIQTELDLTYATRFYTAELPDAYEVLLLDVFAGRQTNFVRTDELAEAWRVFTPALHQIDQQKQAPVKYVFGSQSFKEADDLEIKYGLKRDNY